MKIIINSSNFSKLWIPAINKIPSYFFIGDMLAPSVPKDKFSLIYVVDEIDNDGKLHLVSQPINYTETLSNLVTTSVITADQLFEKGWHYFNVNSL